MFWFIRLEYLPRRKVDLLTISVTIDCVLNAQEAESLIRVAKRGAAAVALINAEGILEKSLEALEIAIEAIVESRSVQFIVGNTKGLSGSFSMYLKIIKVR